MPEQSWRAHEAAEVPGTKVFLAGAALLGLMVFTLGLVAFLFTFVGQPIERTLPRPMRPAGPALQVDPVRDLQAYRLREDERLSDTAAMPIEEAMKIVGTRADPYAPLLPPQSEEIR
ncbi:hypothetical protein [Afifella marina]|uniref:Uncharacterized protein n=1 Tax=Afifella marina DSM 2698 TaxID=1120955 RepID=A0A1G5MVN9_AFIMA|nr:hypothetical protein [Afifella marina]MBK1621974.1 hypothetical protein [Afifella marina DSM 2698]MBK1627767.1 hypothetical protein [Afifella marina]MBK5916734.1 hypothetical protein [Afifella marina]RAI19939.1 hypothetical protein CH311_11560 [Afifella marina DSM 2698]SCZ28591.1 hypothetical protein SAMN03080610_01002 [Afifella marina DSM 2698]